MTAPTSKAIRRARRALRDARRFYWLSVLAVVVGAVSAAASVWSAVVNHSGIAAGVAFVSMIWTTGWLIGWPVCAHDLDKARDSLDDAMDDERARLTHEAERELRAFERRRRADG